MYSESKDIWKFYSLYNKYFFFIHHDSFAWTIEKITFKIVWTYYQIKFNNVLYVMYWIIYLEIYKDYIKYASSEVEWNRLCRFHRRISLSIYVMY